MENVLAFIFGGVRLRSPNEILIHVSWTDWAANAVEGNEYVVKKYFTKNLLFKFQNQYICSVLYN